MGACCAALFKMFMDKYGQEFVTLMVCENGKIFVRKEFVKVKAEFQKVFGGATTHANTLIDSKTSELTKVYESEKAKVAAIPGALQALEKSQGKPIDDISGFNSLKGEIATVRKDTLAQMQNESTTIEGQMKKAEDTMIADLTKKEPRIAEYDNLNQKEKDFLIKEADKQLKNQITSSNQGLASHITGQFGPSTIQNAFGKFSPQSKLDSIVGGAGGKFASALGGGNPLGGGGIGGFL